jgi:ribosome-associated protein
MSKDQNVAIQECDTLDFIVNTVEDIKAVDVTVLDVKHLTELFDNMVIAGATSKQHASSIAANLRVEAKRNQIEIVGIEGDDVGEWVLIDLGSTVVHVMTESIRKFYELEKLWDIPKENNPKI